MNCFFAELGISNLLHWKTLWGSKAVLEWEHTVAPQSLIHLQGSPHTRLGKWGGGRGGQPQPPLGLFFTATKATLNIVHNIYTAEATINYGCGTQ